LTYQELAGQFVTELAKWSSSGQAPRY
jgi:hypothetical protein